METVEEYNRRRTAELKNADELARKTGVMCPKCAKKNETCEMFRPSPYELLMTNPPTVKIQCPACGHEDIILA